MKYHPQFSSLRMRFDVMLVGRNRLSRHLPGAFRTDD